MAESAAVAEQKEKKRRQGGVKIEMKGGGGGGGGGVLLVLGGALFVAGVAFIARRGTSRSTAKKRPVEEEKMVGERDEGEEGLRSLFPLHLTPDPSTPSTEHEDHREEESSVYRPVEIWEKVAPDCWNSDFISKADDNDDGSEEFSFVNKNMPHYHFKESVEGSEVTCMTSIVKEEEIEEETSIESEEEEELESPTEEAGDEGSDGAGSSSVESTAEAIWPVEAVEQEEGSPSFELKSQFEISGEMMKDDSGEEAEQESPREEEEEEEEKTTLTSSMLAETSKEIDFITINYSKLDKAIEQEEGAPSLELKIPFKISGEMKDVVKKEEEEEEEEDQSHSLELKNQFVILEEIKDAVDEVKPREEEEEKTMMTTTTRTALDTTDYPKLVEANEEEEGGTPSLELKSQFVMLEEIEDAIDEAKPAEEEEVVTMMMAAPITSEIMDFSKPVEANKQEEGTPSIELKSQFKISGEMKNRVDKEEQIMQNCPREEEEEKPMMTTILMTAEIMNYSKPVEANVQEEGTPLLEISGEVKNMVDKEEVVQNCPREELEEKTMMETTPMSMGGKDTDFIITTYSKNFLLLWLVVALALFLLAFGHHHHLNKLYNHLCQLFFPFLSL